MQLRNSIMKLYEIHNMQIQQIRSLLTEQFYIVYPEFQQICNFDQEAVAMLSKFFFWADKAENMPHRNGWFWQTAKDLHKDLGLTRRGYEKARRILLDIGVISYRKAGVFNKMHWRINSSKLVELICKVRGIQKPVPNDAYRLDSDGFRVPNLINIELWNCFTATHTSEKKKPTNKQKIKWVNQLRDLSAKGFDISIIMQTSIERNWYGFFNPNDAKSAKTQNIPSPYKDFPDNQANTASTAEAAQSAIKNLKQFLNMK